MLRPEMSGPFTGRLQRPFVEPVGDGCDVIERREAGHELESLKKRSMGEQAP
jgi:hypothetical protein